MQVGTHAEDASTAPAGTIHARLARLGLFAYAVALLAVAPPAFGRIALELREVGGDVVLTGTGNLDPSGLSLFLAGASLGGQIDPDAFVLTGAPGGLVDVYDLPVDFSGPASIGPGTLGTPADSGTGHGFGLNFAIQRLGMRPGITGRRPHNGSSTWLGTDLATLGVKPGIYYWSWGSGITADSITLYAIGGACNDQDGDGYGTVGHVDCLGGLRADCDDTNPLIHPAAADVCDAVDNDCDGVTDEGNVCSASLVDGTLLTMDLSIVGLGPVGSVDFNLVLGGPDVTGANIFGMNFDIDVEDESVVVVVTNPGGGLGNVAGTAAIRGLAWTDPSIGIVGASATSDFDYVYESQPPPFPAPGGASIVDGGHGVEVYFDELLYQSGEVHTTTVSFAAGPPPPVPALTATGLGLVTVLVGAVGVVVVRRKAATSGR